MIQVLSQYGRGSKVAFIMSLAEPLVLIGGVYLFRGVLRANTPNYGTSLFLFYASGFLPFYVFVITSVRARATSTNPRARLPGHTALDIYIAAIALTSVIWITMIVAIFLCMWLYGIEQARPASIVDCALSILLLIVLGTGVGMINNVINRFMSFWNRLFGILTRGMIFLSGVIMIVDLQPLWLRTWSIVNPLSHGIEWFRLGVYGRYPHNSLDKAYLIEWALVALFLGMVVDRAALRKLDKR